MLEVISADYMENYKIFVHFSNGQSGIVDLEGTLWGTVFEPLNNIDIFRRFEVSSVLHTIKWENDADLAPEFLHEKMLESARKETDQFM